MVHYLDKGSERLAEIPEIEVKAALKDQAGNNPFLPANAGAKRGAT
jgi:hypothetical protein